MERIEAQLEKLLPPSSDETTISLASPTSLPAATASALLRMMAQAQARYPNQQLPELTQEMYLTEWEKLTEKYGLPIFRDGLLKAIHESQFFPDPKVIRDYCAEIASGNRSRADAEKVIAAHDAMKAQWLKERAERMSP